ncbi:MAG: hypothetical protein ACHQXA_04575 [Gemmatimonadales bacterium]
MAQKFPAAAAPQRGQGTAVGAVIKIPGLSAKAMYTTPPGPGSIAALALSGRRH